MINCHFQYLCVEITGGYTILVSSDKFIEPSKSGKNSKPIIHTAKPGSPTIFAPISFSAWNSAHHRPRKVTPVLSPIVNATQLYHIHDSCFAGICFPRFSQAGFRQSWGQVCESQCLREGLRRAYAGIRNFRIALWSSRLTQGSTFFLAGGRSLTFTKPITVAPQTV